MGLGTFFIFGVAMQTLSLVFPLSATSTTLRLQLSAAGVGVQLAKIFAHCSSQLLENFWSIFGLRGSLEWPWRLLVITCAPGPLKKLIWEGLDNYVQPD